MSGFKKASRNSLFISMLIIFAAAQSLFSQEVETRADAEQNIRVFIFNRMFKYISAPVVFISLSEEGKDPSAELLKNFRSMSFPVKKVSLSEKKENDEGLVQVYDKTTGQPGAIVYIDKIEWVSDDEVYVTGGHFRNDKSVSSKRYHLVMKDGKWALKAERPLWIL